MTSALEDITITMTGKEVTLLMTALKNNALLESLGIKCDAIDERPPIMVAKNWLEAKAVTNNWR